MGTFNCFDVKLSPVLYPRDWTRCRLGNGVQTCSSPHSLHTADIVALTGSSRPMNRGWNFRATLIPMSQHRSPCFHLASGRINVSYMLSVRASEQATIIIWGSEASTRRSHELRIELEFSRALLSAVQRAVRWHSGCDVWNKFWIFASSVTI